MFSGLDIGEAEEVAAASAKPSAARNNSRGIANIQEEQRAALERLLVRLHEFLQDALQQTVYGTEPGAPATPITAEGMDVLKDAMLNEAGAQAALAAVHARFGKLRGERPIAS